MDINACTPYIDPNLLLATSFNGLLEDYRKYGKYFSWAHKDERLTLTDLLNQQLVFVVGEPGQGKSRLLEELEKKAQPLHLQTARLDLKLRGRDESIQSFLLSRTTGWNNKKSSLVLLDGLDEVSTNDIAHAIRHIRDFIAANPTHKVIIASRLHYFSKYEPQFSDLKSAKYVLIEPFEIYQTKAFLQSLGIAQERIKTIVSSLRLNPEEPIVLQNPRYLEFLAQLLGERPEIARTMSRAVIFDSFVDRQLEVEDRDGKSLKAIKRRFLEHLALTMEIAQLNEISERDFVTFLDKAKSDAKLALISQVNIDELYGHSLLKKDGSNLAFDNAEIQEYLAANAIANFKDPWHVIFEVAIEPNLRELYPSWINTMSFVVDELPDLLPELAALKGSPEAPEPMVVDEGWHRLLTGATSSKVPESYKQEMYDRVLNYYFSKNLRISDDIALNLANYASTENLETLIPQLQEKPDDEASRIKLGNVIRLLTNGISLRRLINGDSEKVKAGFIAIGLNDKIEDYIRGEAIDGLSVFEDPAVLDQLVSLLPTSEREILDSLQGLAIKLDHNYKTSVQIFIEGARNKRSQYRRYGLLGVDSTTAIQQVLEAIIQHREILFSLIEHNNLFEDEQANFLAAIDKDCQQEWLSTLKSIIAASFDEDAGYYATRSSFVQQLAKIIGRKDPTYFREFVELASAKYRFVLDEVALVAAAFMRVEDVAVLKDIIDHELQEHLKWHYFSVLRVLPRSDNPLKGDIEAAARTTLPLMYAEYDKAVAAEKKKKPVDRQLIELQGHISKATATPPNLESLLQAIKTLENESRDDLRQKVSEDDKQKLWDLTKEHLLDKFDPADTNLTINDEGADGVKNYTITSYTHIFSQAIKFAEKTKRTDLAAYRSKLINLIPYAYDDLKTILTTLQSISKAEGEKIVEAYRDQSSDKAHFMPGNLIEVAEHFNLKEAVPVLDQFVDGNFGSIWHKERAIEVSENLQPNRERLKALFNHFNKSDTLLLAFKANALLIAKHEDEEAIEWQVKRLIENPFEHVYQMEVHSVSTQESELRDGRHTAALKTVKNPKFIDTYIRVLVQGLKLISKGTTWHNYAYYLWGVVDQYFSNLLLTQGYDSTIKRLEQALDSYDDKVAISYYLRHLATIKQTYLNTMGHVTNFADAINRHNHLEEQEYLPVRSEQHLFEIVCKALDKDWRAWIIDEGRKLAGEKVEQVRIFIELKSILMQAGFVGIGKVEILREAQNADGTATDYLLYYGFYGPIIIELKKSSHGDIKGTKLESKESYKSLRGYLQKYHARFAIFLVYDDEGVAENKWNKHIKTIKAAYEKLDHVKVIGVQPRLDDKKKDNRASGK